ncbi:dethiobiotin synthase [Paenibacillus sp. 481]|nr:dethiobiotin synthase [Paenibacillus sp. 481]
MEDTEDVENLEGIAGVGGNAARGVFISSTGTGVGKTVVTSGLAAYLQAIGCSVDVWKPVQSGVELGAVDADSYRLRWGSGLTNVTEEQFVTLTLPEPLAPWMAAERCGRHIDVGALIAEGQRRLRAGALLVEGAGGIAVPFNEQVTMADFAYQLRMPVLLVAAPGLGTVSHTVTAIQFARSRGITDIAVLFSGSPEQANAKARVENARMIEALAHVPVLGDAPWLPQPTAEWGGEGVVDEAAEADDVAAADSAGAADAADVSDADDTANAWALWRSAWVEQILNVPALHELRVWLHARIGMR